MDGEGVAAIEDLLAQNKRMEARMKEMMEDREENNKLAQRLVQMETLMKEAAAATAAKEKMQQENRLMREKLADFQLKELRQKKHAELRAAKDKRIQELQEESADASADAAATSPAATSPPPRRISHARTKPTKPTQPATKASTRRSPRLAQQPKRTPSSPKQPKRTPSRTKQPKRTPSRRKLAYNNNGSSKKKKQRRSADRPRSLVRKTIGEVLRLNMDSLIQSQFFRDADRNFKRDEFSHRVTPLLNVIEQDEEIDTSMYDKEALLNLAVSVAKKRSYYSPAQKNAAVQNKRVSAVKALAMAAAVAATSAVAAAAATPVARPDDSPATPAARPDDSPATPAATNETSTEESATPATPAAAANESTEESGDDGASLRDFLELNETAQKARNTEKEKLAKYKKQTVTVAATESAHGNTPTAEPRSESAHGKSTRAEAIDLTKRRTKKRTNVDCDLSVGMRVHGFWPDKDDDPDGGGQWYEGIVEGVDYVERTVNILYEDGDRDDSVPWAYTRILDDIPDPDDSS